VQYSVKSDTEIQILYMSDEIPDEEESQYVRVSVSSRVKSRNNPAGI